MNNNFFFKNVKPWNHDGCDQKHRGCISTKRIAIPADKLPKQSWKIRHRS